MTKNEVISAAVAFVPALAIALYVTLVDGSATAFYGSSLAFVLVYFAVLYWLEERADRTRSR
jgi:hypothetical protein